MHVCVCKPSTIMILYDPTPDGQAGSPASHGVGDWWWPDTWSAPQGSTEMQPDWTANDHPVRRWYMWRNTRMCVFLWQAPP